MFPVPTIQVRISQACVYYKLSYCLDVPLVIIDNEDGTYSSTFKAKKSGNYTMNVKYCEVTDGKTAHRHVYGSPQNFYVAQAELGMHTQYTVAKY